MGHEPMDALYDGIRVSSPCWTICQRGEPIGVFGLVGSIVWLLATPRLRRLRRGMVREARWWVDELQGDLPVIRNIIDSRQTKNIRWLRALGFTVDPEACGAGVNGETFHYFWRTPQCAPR